MKGHSRRLTRIFGILCGVALAPGLSAPMDVGAKAIPPGGVAGQYGHLGPHWTVDPRQLQPGPAGKHPQRRAPFLSKDPSAFLRDKASSQSSATAPRGKAFSTSKARTAASVSTPSGQPINLLTFPGMSEGQQAAQFGTSQALEPPDTQVAAGPDRILEMVNATGSIWTKSGAAIQVFDLNLFYHVSAGFSFSDPRVLYDPPTGRFIASGMSFDANLNSQVYLAMSRTSDPAGLWDAYQLPGPLPNTNGPGVLFDQPKLGASTDKIVLSWQDFTCPAGSACNFQGEETRVIEKSQVASGANPVIVSFGPDTTRFGLIPAQELSASSTAYLAYAQQLSLQVVLITGTPAAHNVVWTEQANNVSPAGPLPPDAQQPNGGPLLNTGDDRFLSAVWNNGALWLTSNQSCTFPGETVTRSCAGLTELSTDSFSHPPVFGQAFGQPGAYTYYPAVSLDQAGNPVLVFTESSITMYPAVVSLQGTGVPAAMALTLQAGAGTYDASGCGGSSRWGDYSGAAVDPADPSHIWVAGEYTASATDPCDWGTAISLLKPQPPPTVATLNPDHGGTAGGTVVTVSGTAFTGATSVMFGSVAAAFTVDSDTQITATSPPSPGLPQSPYAVRVVVTTPAGFNQDQFNNAGLFTYNAPKPAVAAISPSSGSAAGGTIVTISGDGFTAATSVGFGNVNVPGSIVAVPSSRFLSNVETQIVVPVPGMPPGTVDVTVSTAGGTSGAVAADQFIFTSVPGGAPGSINTSAGGLGAGTPTAIGQTPSGLAFSAGHLYVSDFAGQLIYDTSSIRALDTATGKEVVVAGGNNGYAGDGGPPTSAQMYSPRGLAVDSGGAVYFADSGNMRVRLVKNGTVVTVAGNGSTGYTGVLGDGGPATAAPVNTPSGIALDAAGNLFIADTGQQRVRRVDHATQIITTIAGGGSSTPADGLVATSVQLNNPYGVAVDGSGVVYFADTNGNRVWKVTTDGKLHLVAGTGTSGFSGDTGPATTAQLSGPMGIALDGLGNLFIADSGNQRVRKVGSGTITTFAGNGTQGFGGDGGLATAAQLSAPEDVISDGAASLYIADTGNLRARRVDTAGKITTAAGTGSKCGFVGDGAAATSAELCHPNGVAFDAAGNAIIADTDNNRVRRVAVGGTIGTIAGTGVPGFSGDNGPATSAQLMSPKQVAVDGAGNLFIADTGNNRIRRVGTAGTITTVAGGGVGGVTLNGPTGLAVDSAGNLFIADTGDHKVLKLVGAAISVFAGTGVQGSAGDGGPATQAQLNNPMGLAIGGSGNLDIADRGNALVRQVSGSTGTISTIAGNVAVQGGVLAESLALTPSGKLLVGDSSHVWQAMPDGWLVPIAGGGAGFSLGDGGPARLAYLVGTAGLAVDKNGNILIAENGRHRVRRVTPAVAPGAPANVTAKAGIGKATVSWVLPYDGGSPAVTYSVTPYLGSTPQAPTIVTGPTPGDSPIPTSATVTGLTHASYTFAVTATTVAGTGPSASSGSVTITTAPGPPVTVSAMPRDAAAIVSWTAPADDGGSPITAYIVTSSPSGGIAGTLGATSTNVPELVNGTSYTFTVQAITAVGTSAASGASNAVTPFTGGSYHSLPPTRIVDTRPASQVGLRGAPLGPQDSMDVQITGQPGVPSTGVSAVVVNVTVTNTTAGSFLTVYPAGVPRPFASNLNWVAGTTTPNLVEVAVGKGGQISIYNAVGRTDVIVDVQGYVGVTANSAGRDGLFNALVPSRLLDTRDGTGTGGVVGPLGQQSTLTLQVAGRGDVPQAHVSAVVMNVTETQPSAGSYLTVYPSDVQRPFASNLNFVRGQTVPNRVIVKLSTDGKGTVTIFNAAGSVHVIADVNGWFTDATSTTGGSHFVGITPHRLIDTREPGFGPLGPQGVGTLQLTGQGANQISAVVLNVTVTNPTAPSFLTLWPDQAQRPFASDLNYIRGLTVPNLVVVKLGPNATLDVYNAAGSTDVIMDLVGYYGAPVPAPSALRLVPRSH